MLKILYVIIGCFLLLQAKAQLTNQADITHSLSFELLEATAATRTNHFNSNEQILFRVTSTDKRGHVFALLPREQTFIFELHDTNGNLMKKTKLGIQNSQPLDVEKIVSDLKISHPDWTDQQRADFLPYKLKIKHNPISPDHILINNLFVPESYFVITNKGTYTLDVQIRAWAQKTNGQYGIVVSSPVQVEVEKN